jgi:hypothetical protein
MKNAIDGSTNPPQPIHVHANLKFNPSGKPDWYAVWLPKASGSSRLANGWDCFFNEARLTLDDQPKRIAKLPARLYPKALE